jgi:hypothetical protein
MRAIILLGLVTIAIAINKESITEGSGNLIAAMFLVSIGMDICDFIKNLSKSKD